MPRPILVIASNNPGKLREFQRLLDGCGFELTTPRELGVPFDVDETGSTFEDNARLKAVAAAESCGHIALADDSGLEVDALDGRPGIYSARYAGPSVFDAHIGEARQLELLLGELAGVPDAQRTARFRCVIAIATPGSDDVRYTDGTFEGHIGYEPRGENGFGYDPIFVVAERKVTSAEMPPDEKNRISHRGQAAAKALKILKEMAGDDRTA